MKIKKVFPILLLLLLIPKSYSINYIPIYLDNINLDQHINEFKQNGTTSLTYQGVYFRVTNTFSKIKLYIEEKQGRDVMLVVNLSKDYIPPEKVGSIVADYNIPVSIYLKENYTQIVYYLNGYTKTEFEISKSTIVITKVKSGASKLFGGKTIYSIPKQDSKEISIVVPKKISNDKYVSTRSIIVAKRSKFHGWFYTLPKKVNSNEHYILRDFGDDYQVLVSFKSSRPDIVRVYLFPEGIRGDIGYFLTKTKLEMSKAIINWFGEK